MSQIKRTLMLGLDAMVPPMMEKFLEEGVLPNFAKLLEKGCFTRVLPVIPAQTPSNWDTIATGSTPGTHGVVQWGSHIPGEPVWEYHRSEAFNAGLCRSEYLWEAGEREGKRSVVMNYAGYPSTTDSTVFIEWLFQPARSYFDLVPPTVYHNCPELNTTDPVELRNAENWKNLPSSSHPLLEAELPVVPSTEGTGPTYYMLIFSQNEVYDTVLIASEKDTSNAIATLSVGDWSDWIKAEFSTADQGEAEGAFRFKLVELSSNGQQIRLYRSDAFPVDGRFCSDSALGHRLVEKLGPYVHSGMSTTLHCLGWLDFETVDEVMAEEAEWWSSAAQMAMEKNNASLLILHWHNLDAMGHQFIPFVDETGTNYEPEKSEDYWNIVRNYYRAADRFVGAFMEKFDDGETVFAIVSDHGMPANKKAVSLVNLFKERGWITLTPDGKDVDWKKSSVFFAQNHLWINLQGRDEGGVVPQEEYHILRSKVMTAMRSLTDPETGEHVFSFVLPREDAPIVGLWGEYIGDLVFCYEGGYRWSGTQVMKMDEERVVFPCGGGNHGPMIPTYETEATSVMASMVLSGPGIRSDIQIPKDEQAKFCTTDIAPTLAYLLNFNAPAQSEGRVLQELLSDFYSQCPERSLQTTSRPIRYRPTVKPKPVKLQGDVTDEDYQ